MWIVLTLSMAGCDNNATNDAITENMAYINNAYEKKFTNINVDKPDVKILVPVNITRKDDTRDIRIALAATTEQLDLFNKTYNQEYVFLPTELWRFDPDTVTVRKGITRTYTIIHIDSITPQLKKTGKTYALPVALKHADGIGIMKGADQMIYVLRDTTPHIH